MLSASHLTRPQDHGGMVEAIRTVPAPKKRAAEAALFNALAQTA
jgi:hypothetical protein